VIGVSSPPTSACPAATLSHDLRRPTTLIIFVRAGCPRRFFILVLSAPGGRHHLQPPQRRPQAGTIVAETTQPGPRLHRVGESLVFRRIKSCREGFLRERRRNQCPATMLLFRRLSAQNKRSPSPHHHAPPIRFSSVTVRILLRPNCLVGTSIGKAKSSSHEPFFRSAPTPELYY